jgi:hypothetical protein
MLTGRVPFRADTPIATMYRHVNEDAPPPSTIAPVQPELEDVVLRCLEKDPKRRFASAAELEAALLAVPLARGGDTMRFENVGAAENQPVGPGDAVAGGAIAASAAGAVAADDAEIEPVAPAAADGGGLGSRRTAPSHAPPRRIVPGRRPWLIAALVVALLVALAGVLVAITGDTLPTRAAARDAAREAAQNALPPETPPTFANAWSGLVAAIGSAQAKENISDHAAEELVKDADELLGAYREGDSEKVGESLQHLDEHLAKAVEDGEISPAAANAVEAAIGDLATALQNEDALGEVVPTEAPTGPTEESGGKEDKHGSPPYGEANGHDED